MKTITNFFPVQLPFENFEISRIDYSFDLLRQLRREHNSTHSFFRNSDYIYVSPMVGQPLQLGHIVSLVVKDNLSVVSSLIKHIFFRSFREKFPEIVPISFYPFRILSRRESDDAIWNLLPEELQGVLSYKKLIEIQIREIEINDCRHLGILINLQSRWIFSKNCAELANEGFAINGREVLISEVISGLEGILAPDESLIGSVKTIDQNTATAEIESNDGIVNYPLTSLYLHRSDRNIRDYLEFKLEESKVNQIFFQIRQKDESSSNAHYYHTQIKQTAKTISELVYQNLDSFTFSIASQPITPNKSFDIRKPSFLFDYNPGASHTNPSIGLLDYGPYDSSTFSPKRPVILVCCHKSNRGGFADFVGKLRDGIPSSAYFKGGMKGKYRLHDIVFDFVEFEDYSINEYGAKLTEYIRSKSALPDLAIIETVDWFRKKSPRENPYYRAKAYLLSSGVPVQFVKNDNTRKLDKEVQWICESIALQMYAKLGGIPWVLPANQSVDHEIIVGIGSTVLRENRFTGSAQEKIVGITTFFSGDGRYIFGNRCQEVPYNQYFDHLLRHLQQSVIDISQDYGWRENDTIRIIFHVFKPIKNIEVEVVDALIGKFTNYDIRYCFVTVSEQHPFLMFDPSQAGIGRSAKGKFVPQAGINWVLDETSCVLQLRGSQDIKSTRHRFSRPVLIKIHDKSTYRDLNSIVQQVFNFTYLSWRGFHPVPQPATLLYSDLIAKLLTSLRKIESWKPELVNSVLRAKKWFL